MSTDKPFRWNLANRRALDAMFRTLAHADLPGKDSYFCQPLFKMHNERIENTVSGFGLALSPEIIHTCARIAASAPDCDLVFVGRSPETFFDYLSGLFFDSSWRERIILLQFSYRFVDKNRINWTLALPALRNYFRTLKLDPANLMRRERPVAFVDLVCSGETFGNLIHLLAAWAKEEGIEWKSVRRKIRLLGLTSKCKASPKARRWTEQANWLDMLESGSVKNIAIHPELWDYFGNRQRKVTPSFRPENWGKDKAYSPARNIASLAALRMAIYWFGLGQRATSRDDFASLLCEQPEMKRRELREMVAELRQTRRTEKRLRKNRSRSLPASLR